MVNCGVSREHDPAGDVADASRGEVCEAPGDVVVADILGREQATHGDGVDVSVEKPDDVGAGHVPSVPPRLTRDSEAEEARGWSKGCHNPECDRLDRLPRKLARN